MNLSANNDLLNTDAIRRHFLFPDTGRIVTNNAASTQLPCELVSMYHELAKDYENVHSGQSTASRLTTELFEESYDTIARFINAPGHQNIMLFRNTTEGNNAVMYSLLTEFRDGDNVVATMMEHNSNYVPWYALCKEILPKFDIRLDADLFDLIRTPVNLTSIIWLPWLIENKINMLYRGFKFFWHKDTYNIG